MKTTVEIDEKKLRSLLKLTGIKTKKAGIDFAIEQAERLARVNKLLAEDSFFQTEGEVIDPNYNLDKMRSKEIFKCQ